MTTKTVCSFPINLDITEARTPWQITHARKTPYIAPLDGVHCPSRATTMTERNMRAKPSAKHGQSDRGRGMNENVGFSQSIEQRPPTRPMALL